MVFLDRMAPAHNCRTEAAAQAGRQARVHAVSILQQLIAVTCASRSGGTVAECCSMRTVCWHHAQVGCAGYHDVQHAMQKFVQGLYGL